MPGATGFPIPLTVLSVCVGNICRSPASEHLLRQALGDRLQATSAGTEALAGMPIHPEIAARLAAVGVDPTGVARQLSAPMLSHSDLVLVMTTKLRSHVVGLAPSIVRRTFTLAEFAWLADWASVGTHAPGTREELVGFIAKAASERARVVAAGVTLDVADPFGGEGSDYTRAFTEIQRYVDQIVRAFTG